MAEFRSTVVIGPDLCEIVRSWPLCSWNGAEHTVVTHCQFPNGSLVKVRIRRSGDRWIVSDGGAALDEAASSGIGRPVIGLNIRRAIRSKGLSFVEGRIESPRIDLSSLFNAVVVVANASRDIADTLIYVGSSNLEDTLEKRTRRIIVGRFHTWVHAKPVIINGASERGHKFENSIDVPDGRKILIDVVRHQGNSINSSIVANLDIQRLRNDKIVQRIVFDPEESWKSEEIELLSVGAVPVSLPNLADAIDRIAA